MIGITTILLQDEKVTAPYLAEKFEVSQRTIFRDIDALCRAGIPITTAQGYEGGISIAEGYKINKTLFTEKDLKSILTGLKMLDSISDVSHTKQLVNKLSHKDNIVVSNSEPILIDLVSQYSGSLVDKIKTIKSAIYESKRITFNYYYSKGEVRRVVEPYLLVFRWSAWYLLCYCLEKSDFRLFKLNRLWNLECLEKTFEPGEVPEKALQVGDFFSQGVYLRALFDEKVKYRLIDEYGIDSFTYCDGKLLFEAEFTSKEYLLTWILGFGNSAKIIEPKELQQELIQYVKGIIINYEGT